MTTRKVHRRRSRRGWMSGMKTSSGRGARTPLWQWILPALGIILSYTIAVMSRQLYEMRSTRSAARTRTADDSDENAASA